MKNIFSRRLGRVAFLAGAFFALAFLFAMQPASAQKTGYLMTQTEKDAIKDVIREFVRENPSYIMEVLQETASQEAAERAKKQSVIESSPEALYNSKFSPYAGNPEGKIVVVEFFDYNCGYCKRMINDVNRVIEEFPNVKFIFKEMPILSDASQIASRYALAAHQQGKYLEMHTALMKHFGTLDEKEIMRIANGLDLDLKKLQADLYNTEIGDGLTENTQLAQELGIRGTPFFVINDKVMPGAVGYDRLASEIRSAESNNANKGLGAAD